MGINKIIYDIEVYPNYFCFNSKLLNENKWFRVELNEFSDKEKTLNQLETFLKQKAVWIAFNQIHYDNVILNFLFKHKNNFYNVLDLLKAVKNFNDVIIDNQDNYEIIKPYKYNNLFYNPIIIDLFLYWSKGLRISKKISLKSLGVGLNHYKLQELPYDPSTDLTLTQQQDVFKYCDNDVLITEKLYNNLYNTNNTKTGSVKLRQDVFKQTGLNCYSWDTPKIASETLLQNYSQITGKDIKEIRDYRFEKPLIRIKDLFTDYNFNFQTEKLKQIYNNIMNSVDSVKEEFIFNCKETIIKISIGNGGIHSSNKNEVYKECEHNYLITSDVASLYPTNIINAKTLRFLEVLDIYIKTKQERLKAKAEGNKAVDKFKKLILNSISGLIDSGYSWLYYPEGALKLRLLGQLQLLTLVEKAALNNFKVLSINTDGRLKCPLLQ